MVQRHNPMMIENLRETLKKLSYSTVLSCLPKYNRSLNLTEVLFVRAFPYCISNIIRYTPSISVLRYDNLSWKLCIGDCPTMRVMKLSMDNETDHSIDRMSILLPTRISEHLY